MPEISIITPTHNRAYIISQLYNSIKRQTYHNFEWIIIDDGSNDDTRNLIDSFQKDNNTFEIRYFYQENGGKHRAINKALSLARGRLFFIMDDDDWLTDDALESIVRWEDNLPKDGKWCGISGNLGYSIDFSPNKKLPANPYDATLFERYTTLLGERAYVFYTDVARLYPYPEYDGEKFMTEAVVYNRMARDGWKMRFFDEIIWVYKYLEDGLTRAGNNLFIMNPMGYGLWLKEKQKFMNPGLKDRLKLIYTFSNELNGKQPVRVIAKAIGTGTLIIMVSQLIHNLKTLICTSK